MDKEFNLSERIHNAYKEESGLKQDIIEIEDVKEFIRILKEFRDFEEVQTIHIPIWELDKLAGEKLT